MDGEAGKDKVGGLGPAILLGLSGAVLVSALVWWFVSTRPPRAYAMGSPEELVSTARQMVENGEPGRLVELLEPVAPGDLETDPARMEDLYLRLGRVLERADGLARAVGEAFPSEIARMKEEILEAEARGESYSLLGALGRGGGRPGRGGPPLSEGQREALGEALTALLADPYRFAEQGESRIGFVRIDDKTRAITWDGRSVLPPFGVLVRRQSDGRWQVVPPTSMPMVRRFMPKTEDEFKIWGSLMATLENVLIDLEDDVRSGRIERLDDLSSQAFEKAAIPAAMVMMAYGKAREDRAP